MTMELRKVIAIIRCEDLEKAEAALQHAGVPGISVTYVKGFGEYANFFKSPPLVKHVRIEIFTEEASVQNIVEAIFESAHSGLSSDGIIAVQPVEYLYSIRTKSKIELKG